MRTRARGQSMVEFALVAPLLVLLVFGIIDLGRAVFAFSTISEASNVGARLVVPGLGGAQYAPPTDSAVVSAVSSRSAGLALRAAPVGNCDATANPGTPPAGVGWIYINPINWADRCADVSAITGHQPVRVTVRYRLVPATPGLGSLLGGGITLAASATYSTEY